MKKFLPFFVLMLLMAYAYAAQPITSPQELQDMEADGDYILACDIDMREFKWQPIEFNGILDGNGHTIYNLTISSPAPYTRVTIDGNHKEYKTELVGLFASCSKAQIRNLALKGITVDYTTENNAFAACICAFSLDSVFENLSISGSVTLYTGGKMGGVAGVVGFGTGRIADSSADLTLVYVDTNKSVKCEQFLGGANACGYMDILNFRMNVDGYVSVHGYVHNGGVVGMHHNHDKNYKPNKVDGCSCTGQITFFEHNSDRRAYCKAIIGEKLNNALTVGKNNGDGFKSNEVKTYSHNLLPEKCETPELCVCRVECTENAPGYDIVTCLGCGYTYLTNYTLPGTCEE